MLNDLVAFFSAFWFVFSFSFLVALTGALSPGPLLTYTIIKSASSRRRGYLMGIWIIAGHALIELMIVLLLLLGFSFILKHGAVVRVIGLAGGLILLYFGYAIIRDLYRGKVDSQFLNPAKDEMPVNGRQTGGVASGPETSLPKGFMKEGKLLGNPVVGGMVVSMANPYWWVWWATIGFAFMLQFDVSFDHWPRLVAFFLGHEAGDLAWYLVVSFLSFYGLRHLSRKAYHFILGGCGVFMMLFGLYLAAGPFIKA